MDYLTKRSKVKTLFSDQVFKKGAETQYSKKINSYTFSEFALYLDISTTGSYTDETLVFTIQGSADGGDTWFDLQNDFWGDLRYTLDQGDLKEVLKGPCFARDLRLKITSAGTDGGTFFTVSAYIELYR